MHNPICLTLNFGVNVKSHATETVPNVNREENQYYIDLDFVNLKTKWKHDLVIDYKNSFDENLICDLHDRLDNVNVNTFDQTEQKIQMQS